MEQPRKRLLHSDVKLRPKTGAANIERGSTFRIKIRDQRRHYWLARDRVGNQVGDPGCVQHLQHRGLRFNPYRMRRAPRFSAATGPVERADVQIDGTVNGFHDRAHGGMAASGQNLKAALLPAS